MCLQQVTLDVEVWVNKTLQMELTSQGMSYHSLTDYDLQLAEVFCVHHLLAHFLACKRVRIEHRYVPAVVVLCSYSSCCWRPRQCKTHACSCRYTCVSCTGFQVSSWSRQLLCGGNGLVEYLHRYMMQLYISSECVSPVCDRYRSLPSDVKIEASPDCPNDVRTGHNGR